MALLTLGINHSTASLSIREKVAFLPDQMVDALRGAKNDLGVQEVAILSTCNRTELYVYFEQSNVEAITTESSAADSLGNQKSFDETQATLHWLAGFHKISVKDLEPCHYSYKDEEAVRHIMKVACGLDSLILGEPQILGQIKSAYSVALDAGTVSSRLHSTFQQVFSVAKRVRTETAIGENPVSVAFAAVSLAQQIFSNLKEDTALLIGAGETIELVARHLHDQGIKNIIVANRTLGRAKELAQQFNAQAILLSDIPQELYRADIVISSTASQLPLLGKGAVESALKKRKHKPMFMVDIAVPRDIETEVGDLADVYLYTVDDLRQVIDESKRSREEAAEKAKLIVDEGVGLYQKELRALNSVAVIKAYRKKAQQMSDDEVGKALKALNNGVSSEIALQQLARSLVNKLTHVPTTKLKEAGAAGRQEIISLTQELFDISEQDLKDSDRE